jgi:hypothetical protein
MKRDVLGDRELDAVSGGNGIMGMMNQIMQMIGEQISGPAGPVQDGPTKLFQETLNQVSKNAG